MLKELKILRFAETTSTNDDAKKYIANEHDDDPVLFLALHQNAGRGRQGKSFFSPVGGLYMSLLLPYAEFHAGLSLTAAVAVAVTNVLSTLGVETEIKWVNDIYLHHKKLCGILCEAVWDAQHRMRYIVGIGLNMRTPVNGFPAEIADKITALDMEHIVREDLAQAIAHELLNILERGVHDTMLLQEYRRRSMVLGKEITYIKQGKAVLAVAVDIMVDGSLKVLQDNEVVYLDSGEISLLV